MRGKCASHLIKVGSRSATEYVRGVLSGMQVGYVAGFGRDVLGFGQVRRESLRRRRGEWAEDATTLGTLGYICYGKV